MTTYSSEDKVHEFIEEKILWLRMRLGPRYNPALSVKLYTYFADLPPKNLETRFNEFLLGEFGSISLVLPDNKDYGVPTTSETSWSRRLQNDNLRFPDKKGYYGTIEHRVDKYGNAKQGPNQLMTIDDRNSLHFNIRND